MASPGFRINGGAVGVKASVAAGGSVVATLDSTDGVRSVTWSVIGTDETTTAGSFTLVQSGSVGQTVTLTAAGIGTAGILRAEINGGRNLQTDQADPNTAAKAKWFVATLDGSEVACVNEERESDATFGWCSILNRVVRSVGGGSASVGSTPMLVVRAATTTALPANTRVGNVLTADANGALGTTDGVTLTVSGRVLVKNETTGANHGVYRLVSAGSGGAPWSMARTDEADSNAEVDAGQTVYVQSGTVNHETRWVQTTVSPTLNTTALTYEELTDPADKVVIDDRTSNPTADTIAVRDGFGELKAAWMEVGSPAPAQASGDVRIGEVGSVTFDDGGGNSVIGLSSEENALVVVGSDTGVNGVAIRCDGGGTIDASVNSTVIMSVAETLVSYGVPVSLPVAAPTTNGEFASDASGRLVAYTTQARVHALRHDIQAVIQVNMPQDELASSTLGETEIGFLTLEAEISALAVYYLPTASLTASNTDYATFTVTRYEEGSSEVIATASTQLFGTGDGTGNWGTDSAVMFTISASTLAPGRYTILGTKVGAGVQRPRGIMIVQGAYA